MRNSFSVLVTPLVDKTAVDPDQLALSDESRKGYESESYAHTVPISLNVEPANGIHVLITFANSKYADTEISS